MPGTFVFIHGTGIPDSNGDAYRIGQILAKHEHFHDWKVVCPPWAERLGGTWGNPADALPPDQRGADAPESTGAADFDDLVDMLGDEFEKEIEQPSPERVDDEGGTEDPVQSAVLAAATTVLANNRAAIAVAAGNFIRNVFFYFNDRNNIREWVAREIAAERAKYDGPMVVAGHSLGGVIAVDALTYREQPKTLLVTAGSQMPLFAVLRLAEPLGGGGVRPFKPWLNFYNPRDPLSYYASTVFPPESVFPVGSTPHAESPVDSEIRRPKHLPEVHTGYFEEDSLYDGIWDRLGALGYV
ncbi:hypothetical protein [Microbacterium sp. SS28]|uniref:hypothetical protein n=1 Tax=Microbacterium sp. SS28 TaxID=2919948 RepID=UPI001FA966A6|nr:hypothetical protein [Microbacterium sp. SS28]